MTRLEFRSQVEARRPRSSVLMASVAAITLAITGQVEPWALGFAALGLGVAIHPGFDDSPLRRNAFLLNAGLLAAIGAGAALWARGQLALPALAHFALLAQTLQLLDARPRRTEFLLVALAVFQVVLAANLTDSVLFPPLLVAFTVSVAWTLIVHTLRAEALEAGEPGAASRAITGGLRRTAITASVAAVFLAMALFPVLPRIRSGSLFSGGLGSNVARSGFSDQVEIGEIGRIRLDPTVVLRVETLEGATPAEGERYWRGLAFDHFDGWRWSVTPVRRTRVGGDPEIGVELPGGGGPGERIVQRIAREQIESGVLFTPGHPRAIRGAVGRLERDANESLYGFSTAGQRVDYQIAGRPAGARVPSDDRWATRAGDDARFVQLPSLAPRVRALAESLVADARNDLERTRALERYLQTQGRYTDQPPTVPRNAAVTPAERFLLGETEGHCEYFATGMVVLARSLGAPARLVNGFAGGYQNVVGDFIEVSQSDAHAWVEVHFEKAGWVRFDPTPVDLRLAGSESLRAMAAWKDLASAMELWWFRNVVDFDRGHQARALKKIWLAWRDWRRDGRGHEAEPSPGPAPGRNALTSPSIPAWWILAAAAAVTVVLLAWQRLRRGRRRSQSVPAFYRRALVLTERHGVPRGEAMTAREHVNAVRDRLPPPAAAAFGRLTEAYLGLRFGGRSAPERVGRDLDELRDSLRA